MNQIIPSKLYRTILSVMPIVCVDVVIVNRNKCLLVKRKEEPAQGQYWLPGGRVYKMEPVEKAALRKAKEEVNLRCRFIKIVSIEQTIFPNILKVPKNQIDQMNQINVLNSPLQAPRSRLHAHDPSCAVHSVNICCKLKPLSVKGMKVDPFHRDPMWVNLYMAKRMKLNRSVVGPIKKCLDGA